MAAAMREGVEHFNASRFWHAHEAWESLWLVSTGSEKEFLRGLIQLAAAYHHVQRGTLSGAVRLFDSSLRRLEDGMQPDRGLDLADALAAAKRHRRSIASGELIAASEFPKLGYNEGSFRPDAGPHAFEG